MPPHQRPASEAPPVAGSRGRCWPARHANAAAYRSLLQQVAAGEIALAIDPVPLTRVEKTWRQAGSDRRIVFAPPEGVTAG